MNPRDLVEHALDLLLQHDMAGFAGLFAPDGVVEFPFAAPGYPPRIEGRAAITEYLRGYPELLDIRAITPTAIHQSTDPTVVIAEFTAAGVVTATGTPYELSYIAVLTVVDGQIRHYRDYWSPLAAAEFLGGVDEVTAAFAGADRG